MESIPENLQELSRLLEKAVAEDDEGDWKRFRLPNGQLARMSFSYKDKTGLKYGFRSARVTLETPKAEKAIIAALVALEGKKVGPERLRFASILKETLNKAQANEYSSLRDWAEDLRSNPRLGKAKMGDWHGASTVRYLRELLRHYRPELDELPEYEQVALLEGAAKHINEFLEYIRWGLGPIGLAGGRAPARPRQVAP